MTKYDLTGQAQGAASPQQRDRFYRLLFERSSDAVFLIDASTGKYVDANMAAERLTGRRVSELRTLRTFDVTPQGASERLEAARSLQSARQLGEVIYVRPDGSTSTALLSVVPLGEGLVFGIATDITSLKRAEDEAKQQSLRLEASHKVSQAVASTLDLCSVCSRALEEALRALALDGGAIRSIEERTGDLLLEVTRGLSPEIVKDLQSIEKRVAGGQGLAGLAARSRQPVVVEDLAREPRLLAVSLVAAGFKAAVFMPLLVGDRLVGVLSAYSFSQRSFSTGDVGMLTTLGSMVGMAVSNASLFRNVEKGKREWEQTFDSMSEGVAILDLEERVIRSNWALARLLGRTPSHLKGQEFCQLIYGGPASLECPVRRCVDSKAACERVWREAHLGRRWLRMRAEPMAGPQGDMSSLVVVLEDISEERQRQADLERLHRLSRALSASLDLDKVMETALDEISRMLGEPSSTCGIALLDEEEQSFKVMAAIGPHRQQAIGSRVLLSSLSRDLVRRLMEERRPWVVAEASQADAALKVIPGFLENANAVAMPMVAGNRTTGALFVDRTETRPLGESELALLETCSSEVALALENARLFSQTDAALKRRLGELEAIIASMGEGLIVTDARGIVLYCNRAAQAILALDAPSMVGRPLESWQEALSTRVVQPKEWRKLVADALKSPQGKGSLDLLVQAAERREVQATLFGIKGHDRRLGFGAILRDVTKDREIDRMKSEFVSVASHELRTPMTAILGFAELLLMRAKGLPEEQYKWLEMIHGEAQRLSRIVEDLLNVSRIETGRLSLEIEPLMLMPVVEAVVSQIGQGCRSHSFSLDIPEGLPEVSADGSKLHQVLYNLVDNAVKYSPGGGVVRVRAEVDESEGMMKVGVEDQGVGIPDSELARLFTRFHRVDRAETVGLRGTGLGLYIVKSLVEMMGGRVWVQSVLHQGATFYFNLPLAPRHI